MENKTKKIITISAVVVGLLVLIVLIVKSFSPSTTNGEVDETFDAAKELSWVISRVSVTNNHAEKGVINYQQGSNFVELPDINKSYPLVVEPHGKDVVAEIFVSPEKAGNGTDRWLRDLAEEFNSDNVDMDGKNVGVAIRSISSGTQIEYIETGAYIPDAISPSADIWVKMLNFTGVDTILINEKLVGNVAGVLISKEVYKTLQDTYGTVDIKTVVDATEKGTLITGYTNPFSSTSGLNFLASTLYCYDNANPLSEVAVTGFNQFQNNVPFVAYNTLQMREAADNGTFTSFITEYQTYINNSDLKNNYEFIPYGVRHDNPLYAIKGISDQKLEVLKKFNVYCKSERAVESAKSFGFNMCEDYVSNIPETDGNTWVQMQKVWKKNKNTAKPIAAVFVLDTSGSMSGAPLNALKNSLTNSMKYINSNNYIGVVSYATDVNIALPIGVFDINQQAYFQGAVSGLNATGGTSSYSAVAVAIDMLNNFMVDNPDVQPMVFLLSDGETNSGASYNKIVPIIQAYKIPIYTIGYNANLEELNKVASINEAASINADSDDVVYQLKNLFNANL